MERAFVSRKHLAVLFVLALCAVALGRAAADDEAGGGRSAPGSSERLSNRIVQFSTAAAEVLDDDGASNSYSHQMFKGRQNRLGAPHVQLAPSDAHTALASTDCSGWLSFVLNTVSPLHEAVLQSQRQLPEYNRAYSDDFALRESRRPWARAFVVTQHLRNDDAETTGFDIVADFAELRPGDIGAYAMGRYTKPSDESRPKPKDTGHVFVVVGEPTVVDPATEDYDGRGTLAEDAARVIALPVIDSSSIVHFDPDSRETESGRYTLPEDVPYKRAKPGGVGTGTIWLALNEEGGVLQRRLGPGQRYRPVLARAARLRGRISLDESVLGDEGALEVRVFDDSPAELAGVAYGKVPVALTGEGGVRLTGGRLVLNGRSDFTGGVTVASGELIVGSSAALGTGDVAIWGGRMTLRQPAIARSASVRLADGLSDGAVGLDFEGSNVVQTLQIGDDTQRCGTWGAPESGAMFVDAVFAGAGILELAAEPLEGCEAAPEVALEESADMTADAVHEESAEAIREGTVEGTPEESAEAIREGTVETAEAGDPEPAPEGAPDELVPEETPPEPTPEETPPKPTLDETPGATPEETLPEPTPDAAAVLHQNGFSIFTPAIV